VVFTDFEQRVIAKATLRKLLRQRSSKLAHAQSANTA